MADDPEYKEKPKYASQTSSTWAPVRTAPGLRPNCVIFYDENGFAYHNHKVAYNKQYLKCTQRKQCPARAMIRNFDKMIRHSGEPHTHKPKNYDEDLLEREFFVKIRERASNESIPNRKIFDEEIEKTPILKNKVSFSSIARRIKKFQLPKQKIQGPLFPIEDDLLIDAINDHKNIPDENSNNDQNCKYNTVFDDFNAEKHMEVVEIDDISMDSNAFIDGCGTSNETDKENVFKNNKKETEKTINMFCCSYCNKWQEAQVFELVPNQKSKIIEFKEKTVEKSNLNLLPIDHSNPVPISYSSENIAINNNQNTTLDCSEIHDDTSRNSNDLHVSIHETTGKLNKTSNPVSKKKAKRNKSSLQMRIDSKIYYDNMGYSYQLQTEKTDKIYLRCVNWAKEKCPGRANLNKKTSNIVRSRGHNHLPSINSNAEKQAREFLHAIRGRAQDETTPLRTIYEEEILKFPLATSLVNYDNATRRMQRTRRLKNHSNLLAKMEQPLILSIQVIPGTRRGTSLYLDELGYYYHNVTNNGKAVRCTKIRKIGTEEACRSRGTLRVSGDGFVLYRSKDHNHQPGNLKRNPMERSFMKTLCERSQSDLHLGLKDIYNQEVERFPDVAVKIPYKMAWRSMARVRQPPKVPREIKVVGVSVVSGPSEGHTLYRDNIGYLYSMTKGRKYIWCHMNTKLKCLVRGSISIDNNVSMLEYTQEHNHPPLDDDDLQAVIFIENILLKCLEDDRKPKKLYDDEIVNFPGVEKRISLACAREKIKAKRKCSQKKNVSHDTLDTACEQLEFVEFWGDEHNPIDEDDFTEGIIFSEDEEIDETEEHRYSNQICSDDQSDSNILSTVQITEQEN